MSVFRVSGTGRALSLAGVMAVLVGCAGTTTPIGAPGSVPSASAVSVSQSTATEIPRDSTDSTSDASLGGGDAYAEATCGPWSAAESLRRFATSGSLLIGRVSLTGRTATWPGHDVTVTEVSVAATSYLAGADRGPTVTGWIFGGVGADGVATRVSPEMTSSWSPDGLALVVALDRTDDLIGSDIQLLPVADDQVMFTNFLCFDVADLPTAATTANRQYVNGRDLITDTAPASAYLVADLRALVSV